MSHLQNKALLILLLLLISILDFSAVSARNLYRTERPTAPTTPVGKTALDAPYVSYAIHDINKLGLTITNIGSIGTGFIGEEVVGAAAPSGIYLYPGRLKHIFGGAFWIGAVVGRDTLVSVGADGWQLTREMFPDPYPRGEIKEASILNTDDVEALSEQDFIAIYTDTLTNPSYVEIDPTDGRPHIPINVEISQRSYAWSYAYAEDFILFDYSIKNIGYREIKKAYLGIYLDAEVTPRSGNYDDFTDDICGFRRYAASDQGCGFIDTVNIAWLADNDGRSAPPPACPGGFELTSVTGIRVVRTPSDSLKYSFNWWISNPDASLDFGPRRIGTPNDPFRDFGGFLGTPEGDKNKYYVLRHEEFDYDQLFSAVDQTAAGWLPPSAQAPDFSNGYDTRFLLSFGPFDISPGEVLPVSFAYVAGANFHRRCEDWDQYYQPYNPQPYSDRLDFTDFAKNAMWASWIYDNPGYDSDGNGYFGKYRICVYDSTFVFDTVSIDPVVIETTMVYTQADTLWYEGDGVPDFRGAAPPPPPVLRVMPSIDEFNRGELRVRWNGLRSETEKDIFSRVADFEGYRVYISLSQLQSDFVLVSSYDRDDYNKYIWNESRGIWELRNPPFTLDSLRALYGSNLDPTSFSIDHRFYWMDSIFYFAAQDWNQSELRDTMGIYKRFPDQPPPSTLIVDSAAIYYPEELTEDSLLKYYEYEYVFRNLLPSQLYYVSVTAFDYGSPTSGLLSLESSPSVNMVAEYAQNRTGIVEAEGLNVIVYPNPYRIDGNYRSAEGGGFEGRGQESMPDDRVRAIHFTNLPHKCTIRIFTIDGDLVRQIDHDYPPDSPQSMHDIWDMITRNTQVPVSGIYYYSVESEYGNQVGKIVIIM
ncbi:MAG: hypothetical protein CVT49_08955 [candidate division Zixibacteria bacterium HGW-Zixibacteria-1]|nr:MAG: hypothetical protein CVT49_08955 [candidate division Zixibacteria bacterium HGW-Zixibacteria-1]